MKIFKNQKGFGLVEGLLIVIVLTLVVGVGFYVYNANKEDPQISNSSIQHKQPEPEEAVEEKTVPAIIDYGEEGIELKEKADVDKLTDASEAFKEFMASELPGKATECSEFFNVNMIVRDEFAVGGGGSNCGGGAKAVWMKKDDKWFLNTELGGHEVPLCSKLIKYKVPVEIEEECQDDSKPVEDYNYSIVKNPN